MRGVAIVVSAVAMAVSCTAFSGDEGRSPVHGSGEAGIDGALHDASALPVASVFAARQANPTAITSDGRYVYWVNAVPGGSIMQCPLDGCDGGVPKAIANVQGAPKGIATTSIGVAFTVPPAVLLLPFSSIEDAGAPISCNSIAGSSITTPARMLAHDDAVLIFDNSGFVSDCPSSTCADGNKCTGWWVGAIQAADIDDARAYYALEGEIRSCPLQSSCRLTDPVTHVAPSQPNVASLAVDSLNVYWVDGVAGSIMSIPKGGGLSPTPLATQQNHPRTIALDGTYLYVLNEGTGMDGELVRLRTDGTDLTKLATGLVRPSELLVTPTQVYWTNGGPSTGSGSVMRIAK